MDSASASLIYELLKSDTAAELDRVKRVKVTQPDSDSPYHEAALKSWKREIDLFQSRPQELIAALERANTVENPEPGSVASHDGDHDPDDEDEDDDNDDGVDGNGDDEMSMVSSTSSLSLLSATPSLPDSETDAPSSNLPGCIACMEHLPAENIIECPCSHYYCHDCIGMFVEAALADISIFPPRCCSTPIPWPTMKASLDNAMAQKFEERLAEVNRPAPPVPQVICFGKRCLAPIPARKVQDHVGICSKCKRRTCAFCGEESHAGDCNNKKDWERLEATAKRKKWKMCPNCKAFVSRTDGCNHIRYTWFDSRNFGNIC
ncbi:hypothetical protein N7486_005117 [Penicillium sp. IBT 16267x]|nr:hypothetical protein N7486_005117 [Penicillium sp. IBT 16267x]